jgi:hypothetical protein
LVDPIKITSTVSPIKKIDNTQKENPLDSQFNIDKATLSSEKFEKSNLLNDANFKEILFQNLNKEIFKPLKNSTTAETNILRKLVLTAELFETNSKGITKTILDQFFIGSQDLLSELLTRDKTETIFKGAFFDSLRMLTKLPDLPDLKNAIVSLLRHFDAYVNRSQTLNAILSEINRMLTYLQPNEKKALELQLTKINERLNQNNQNAVQTLLKNETLPLLKQILANHTYNNKLYHSTLTIINEIVRYDKGDSEKLEKALESFAKAMKPISQFSQKDISEMKTLIFFHAKEAENLFARMDRLSEENTKNEKADLSKLIDKALDKSSPSKIHNTAFNLLETMLRNESPIFPIMHFLIPFRFLGHNIFSEFFIDKDPSEKKGNAKKATNIFFTIQSDYYGNFEVELMAKDQFLDLTITCPDPLIDPLNKLKSNLKSIVEEQGYHLSHYTVDPYQEGQTILQRYPKLTLRKVGLNVKI